MFADFTITLTIPEADLPVAIERFLAANPIPAALEGISIADWMTMVTKETANGVLKAGAKIIFDAEVAAEIAALNNEWEVPEDIII